MGGHGLGGIFGLPHQRFDLPHHGNIPGENTACNSYISLLKITIFVCLSMTGT